MIGTIIGHFLSLGFVAVSAGPFVCLLLLARHYKTGAELPAKGAAWIYFGCLCWIGIIATRSAIVEAWRPWVGFPILVGLVLGAVWQRKATPASGIGALISNAGTFVLFGWLGWVVLGGGYFDRMSQVPHALKALQKTGVQMDDAPALARALRDDDLWVRWGAALALERLGPRAAPALDALIIAAEDADPRVGHFAWNSIRQLGPLAAPAAPAVAALLKKGQNDWDVQKFFETCGPKAEAAVPALVLLAEYPTARVRGQALEALASIGPAAKDATLPVLVRIYKSEADPGVKDIAAKIHRKLGISFAEWERAIFAP